MINSWSYEVAFIVLITIYGIQKEKPKNEMQNSQRPHIKANHQMYYNEKWCKLKYGSDKY